MGILAVVVKPVHLFSVEGTNKHLPAVATRSIAIVLPFTPQLKTLLLYFVGGGLPLLLPLALTHHFHHFEKPQFLPVLPQFSAISTATHSGKSCETH